MVLVPPTPGRLRRKLYYDITIGSVGGGTLGFSSFAAIGGGVFAGIIRPCRGAGGADFGPSGNVPYADGADADVYGDLLQPNSVSGGSDRRAKDRITALFECASMDAGGETSGEAAHGCVQFVNAGTSTAAITGPAIDDPSAVARPFIRVKFTLLAAAQKARLYVQKQHAIEV